MFLKVGTSGNMYSRIFSRSSFHRIARFRPFLSITLGLGLLMLALTACTSGTVQQATPSPTPQQANPIPTSPPANSVLFQSDWSQGLSAWKTTSGWKVKNGYIESDLSDALSLTFPYQPAVTNYAVEYRLQIVSVPKDGGQFQLTADQQPGKDGYHADVLNLLTPGSHRFAIHPLLETMIDPEVAMESGAQIYDFEPLSDWHVYRVEVQGTRVSFLVDGKPISRASTIQTPALSTGPIRLLSRGAILRISSLRILTD